MNMRLLALTIFCIVIISGLVTGLFAGSIEKTLTVMSGGNGMRQIDNRGTTTSFPLVSSPSAAIPTVVASVAAPVATGTAGATGSVLASDTFQRADQAQWGIASDGQMWQGDANNISQPVFSITNNSGSISHGQ